MDWWDGPLGTNWTVEKINARGWPAERDDVTIIDWNGETIDTLADPPPTGDIAGTLSIDEYAV